MAKVALEGWREGLLKVSLSKLQCALLMMGLREAKGNVDALLDGEVVVIVVEDVDVARRFLREAEGMGVIGRMEVD